jgi:hypothetical protein
MRRLLSILLLAAFALPLVAPGLALAQGPDAGLPACCRRHGQHHCAMSATERDSSTHYAVAVCAAWPQQAIAPSLLLHPFVGRASSSPVCLTKNFSQPGWTQRHRVTLVDRAHLQRGPPQSPSLA